MEEEESESAVTDLLDRKGKHSMKRPPVVFW